MFGLFFVQILLQLTQALMVPKHMRVLKLAYLLYLLIGLVHPVMGLVHPVMGLVPAPVLVLHQVVMMQAFL